MRERRAEQKGEQKMVDVNRADPKVVLAKLVQPLPAAQRMKLREHKRKSMGPYFDGDWLNVEIPARANSDLLDRLAAERTALVEREAQNESEDDDSDYVIRP